MDDRAAFFLRGDFELGANVFGALSHADQAVMIVGPRLHAFDIESGSVISDAQELKDKDTDRIATTIATLRPFGVQIEAREDGFVIEPSQVSSAKSLVLPPDHRVIFAAMTLASSLEEPTTMSGWEKIGVSFPGCLDLLGELASVSHFEQV